MFLVHIDKRKKEKEGNNMLIAKVRFNKGINVKLVTIPKKSDIKPGDYVRIVKVEE